MLLYVLCLIFFTMEYFVLCRSFKKADYNNGQKRDVIIVLGYPAKIMEACHQLCESE